LTPRVSVVVPVRDGAARIDRCLRALLAQSHPHDRLELIVVDNGSVDETRARVRSHPVTLLVENGIASPYAARNAGIARASGEILAFTDADCAPAKDWIERGLAALDEQAADLVGGRVRFVCSRPPRAAELVDAIRNLDHERSIPERGVAKTANLFVHRRVFDALGAFDGERRSGGDVAFTTRASGAGFTLVYAPDAVVEKPARRAWALARKQFRVGRGQPSLWREHGVSRRQLALRILRCARPERPRALRAELERRAPGSNRARLAAVWLAAWAMALAEGLGRLCACLGGRA